MQTNEIQELLLDTIPAWHYWFARPFKRMLNDGVSLDMYYCIQSMRRSGHTMTMTELANFARMPKQQMSKLVDRLVDGGFAERLSDPDDRRVIRLRATAKADEYIAAFFEKDAAVTVYPIENGWSYSARSLGKINVQVLMENIGNKKDDGGGHLTMAGAQIYNITREEAEQKLREAIDRYYDNLPQD